MNFFTYKEWTTLGAAILLLLATSLPAADGFDFLHSRYAKVLEQFVNDRAMVDYAGLKQAQGGLNAYLDAAAAVDPEDFASWPREDRLALLLNLYNAWTLKLIVDHYPLDSIRDIGLLPGAAWRKDLVRFGGKEISLDELEHDIIRKKYDEPRIHFAVVCAAKGCPPLRSEPYIGERLNAQLEDQARIFLSEADKNRFEPGTGILWLSPIFKWYKEDFLGNADSLADYVAPYFPAEDREALQTAGDVEVKFTDYNWELNDAGKK